jgi:hypothetical protein
VKNLIKNNSIKLYRYKKLFFISVLITFILFFLYNYHSTTYYSCKVELEDSNKDTNWYKVTVSVNKYLGDRYTLNEYKLSECEYSVREDLFRRDNVYCNNNSKIEKEEDYLSFDIVNGEIQMLKDGVYGEFMSYPDIALHNQECRKISRAVD